MMKSRLLLATLAAGSLLAGATWSQARAQALPEGTVYALHSPAAKGCPTLDWHLVTGPNGTVSGMVSWNDMKSMAHVSGTIGAGRTFTMSAKEVGGAGRTATITGQARQDGWLVVNIKGPKLDCEGIVVPIWRSEGTTKAGGG